MPFLTPDRSPHRSTRRPPRRGRRRPGRARLRLAGLAALVALTPVLAACTDAPAPTDGPDPVLTTPLKGYDTSEAGVQRASFCDLVDEESVTEALGEVEDSTEWSDGDRLRSVGDIVQEYGCEWRGSQARSRAWVLAPPVTRGQARRILAEEPARGCRPQQGAPAYGTPSRTMVCDSGRTVRHAGLFGDAWLTCEVSGREVTQDLAGRWCVAVAQAAAS